jgi:DNA helicase-2/ATP-dependent DNA helicase PcrA
MIDFNDMVYAPVLFCGGESPEQPVPEKHRYDWLFVDEVQDLNEVQQKLAAMVMASGGGGRGQPRSRMLAVGDTHQSIYGFRGADVDAVGRLRADLRCARLSLSTCFRCPRLHVQLANELLAAARGRGGDDKEENNRDNRDSRDDGNERMHARVGALEGKVVRGATFVSHPLQGGELILSRTNRPLLALLRELRARKVPCVYVGKAEICENIAELLESVRRKGGWTTAAALVAAALTESADRAREASDGGDEFIALTLADVANALREATSDLLRGDSAAATGREAGEAEVGLALITPHSRVSDWLHGPFLAHTGCHQLNVCFDCKITW